MFIAGSLVTCVLLGQVFGIDPQPVKRGAPAAAPAVAIAAKTPTDAVVTIHAERVEGDLTGFENDQLTLSTTPPRKIALDQVERVEMARKSGGMTLVWIGQDGHDLAQPSATAGANGVQDVHLQCRGLAPGRKLRQVVVFAPRVGGESQAWALEPGATPFWRLHSQQAPGALVADLYLEPPPADCFDQQWEVWMTSDDNQTVKTPLRAATHTDNKLKLDATQPAAEAPRGPANVLLEGDDLLRGEIVGLDEDSLVVKLTAGSELKIPLLQVRACWVGPTRPEKLVDRLSKRGESDWALLKTREDAPADVEGTLKGLNDGKLEMLVGDQSRKVAMDRLLGFVLAARPAAKRPATFYQTVELIDGQKLSGKLTAVKPDAIELSTLWDAAVSLPRAQLQSINPQNGKVVYLSDLEPAAVEETPYFRRARPYRRDHNLEGGPLVVKGTTHRKGLAVHSRSVLTYPLDGHFASFYATVGFDDTAPPGGSVACRVLADGRELYNNPTLRRSGDPVPLKLEVAGAQQLVLEVDFGEAEDIGDRVIWAAARLFRDPPPPEEKPVAEKTAAEKDPAAEKRDKPADGDKSKTGDKSTGDNKPAEAEKPTAADKPGSTEKASSTEQPAGNDKQ